METLLQSLGKRRVSVHVACQLKRSLGPDSCVALHHQHSIQKGANRNGWVKRFLTHSKPVKQVLNVLRLSNAFF